MATPKTPPTVGEIVEALSRLDPSLPLIVSTHYDNDVGYSSDVELSVERVYPTGEGSFWNLQDATSTTTGSTEVAVLAGVGDW